MHRIIRIIRLKPQKNSRWKEIAENEPNCEGKDQVQQLYQQIKNNCINLIDVSSSLAT